MFRKYAMMIMCLAFIVAVVTAIGMETTSGTIKHAFKETHEISGFIFAILGLWHIWSHRFVVKAMFFKPKR